MMPPSPRPPSLPATDPVGSEASTGTMLVNGIVALIGVIVVAALSTLFDARIAAAMTAVPLAAIVAAALVSDLGQSGYMFETAVLIAGVSFLAQRSKRFVRFDPVLRPLRERALYVFGVLATSGILAQVVKHLVGRARPRMMPAFGPYHFDLLSMGADFASFPSGHAATVFAMAVALSLLMPRCRGPLFLFAGLVAASRIVGEAHYASDGVAGGLLGIASALTVTWICAGWSVAFDRGPGAAVRLKDAGVVLRGLRDRPA